MTARGRIGALGAVLAALLAVGACEPSGPGSLTATVKAPVPTGAVVVELAGPRMTGFEGVGGTRTFEATATAADTVRRVIVVSPSGGTIQFRIDVEDIRAETPRAAVVDAVDPSNAKVPTLTGYSVRVAR